MKEIINQIIAAAKRYNLPTSIILAQAILETGWFKRMPYNNIFGIKATQKDIAQRKFFETPTTEVINGVKIKKTLKFRKFNSIDEAVKIYNEIIKRNFPAADKNRSNAIAFLNGLFSGRFKYATDPRYKEKIKKIILDLQKKITLKKTLTISGGAGLIFLTIFYLVNKNKNH